MGPMGSDHDNVRQRTNKWGHHRPLIGSSAIPCLGAVTMAATITRALTRSPNSSGLTQHFPQLLPNRRLRRPSEPDRARHLGDHFSCAFCRARNPDAVRVASVRDRMWGSSPPNPGRRQSWERQWVSCLFLRQPRISDPDNPTPSRMSDPGSGIELTETASSAIPLLL